jgi:hypothetical protein
VKFYQRQLYETLVRYKKFPAIALLGPRQSGKTTLARHTFPNHSYINLDDLELRQMIQEDPKGFLRKHESQKGIIFDEFQNVPELLLYLKVLIDEKNRPGYFVLTGSQNFLVNQAITESLAGRVGILNLLPLSLKELEENNLLTSPEETIVHGGYPRLYQNSFTTQEFYPSYIQTYVERDVRTIINIKNLSTFQKFLKLCAARIGQLLNYSDLATQCGISIPTVHEWLSLLEASFIIFLLRPHWENFNKRVTKTPKIYFNDTGLACSLLEITDPKQLHISPLYGHLFENLILTDLYKQYYNQGLVAPLYFWRDKNGEVEIDCIISTHEKLIPIEIKSGETYTKHFSAGLKKWCSHAEQSISDTYLVYGGTHSFSGKDGHVIGWKNSGDFIKNLV